MSIFDKLNNYASSIVKSKVRSTVSSDLRNVVNSAVTTVKTKTETFTFAVLPKTLDEMQALPEAKLETPYATAALTVCALCAYATDSKNGIEMLNFLRGPRLLSGHDISFMNDRLNDGRHIAISYFKGAKPDNEYTPDQPFTLSISSGAYSDTTEGYKKLFARSGGADNPREIVLRKLGDGRWMLWEHMLLVGIRPPKSENPWA